MRVEIDSAEAALTKLYLQKETLYGVVAGPGSTVSLTIEDKERKMKIIISREELVKAVELL